MSTTRYGNPIAHKLDPTSSHEAAELVTSSGQRATHAEEVYRVVRAHPGLTSAELAGKLAHLFDLTETRRRLTDLLKAGRIEQGEVRACTVGRKRMVTWGVAMARPTRREVRTHQAELFGPGVEGVFDCRLDT